VREGRPQRDVGRVLPLDSRRAPVRPSLADPQGLIDLAKQERDRLARLRRLLEPYRNVVGLHKEAANLDTKAREKLRALGYVW